jgi:hypothetical protein
MRQRWRGRALVVLGAVPALVLAAVAGAPTAGAAAGPAITGGGCTASTGSYLISCQVSWSGGTSPFTVGWTAVSGSSISGGGSTSQHSSAAQGECYSSFEVEATVTDAAGLSAHAYMGGTCGVNY